MIAAIVAGGRARRMGGAVKPLLSFDGERILDRQLRALSAVAREVVIVANDPAPFRDAGVAPDIAIVGDPAGYAGEGPIAGIAAALAYARRGRVLVVAGDMPLLAPAPLAALAAVAPEADAVAPVVGDCAEPLCAIYAARCLSTIESLLAAGERKARRMLDALGAVRVNARDLDPATAFLFNVNRAADLKNTTRSGKH